MAKGPFMEFLRARVLQTAANTYEEVQIPTPTSKTENMAMLIHSIELAPASIVDPAPTTLDSCHIHVAKRSKTIAGVLDDPDILAYYSGLTILDAVFHMVYFTGSDKHIFDPPILYPHANLFAGISTTGFTGVTNAKVRIGYTLEKVSREDFISALVE